MRTLLTVFVLTLCLPLAAMALRPGEPIPMSAMHGPKLMTAPSGVQYINGGFGAPERQHMLAMAPGFTLRLEFTQGGHPYVSGVLASIEGPRGRLHLENAGPMLLANLPAGTYRITGVLEGKTSSASVTLGRGMKRVILRF